MFEFSILTDLFHYYPYLKKKDRNASHDLYYILSSNKAGKPLDLFVNNRDDRRIVSSNSNYDSFLNAESRMNESLTN